MLITLDAAYRPAAEGRFPDHEVRFFPGDLTEAAQFAPYLADTHVLVTRRTFPFPFDAALVAQAPQLQFIHKTGTGVDWFPIPLLNAAGILLANNAGFNAPAVAEHTIMLMLLALRGGVANVPRWRAGEWVRSTPYEPVLLQGKTVGIVGLGAIGQHVARALPGFGARVVATQHRPHPLPAGLEFITLLPLDDLLQQADIVTLHVPLTDETRGLIGPRELALMGPDATLINTTRGNVIDEAALIAALQAGQLRAAGLDVLAQEPTPPDNPLLQMDNVVVTPHIGGGAREISGRQVEGALANAARFAAGDLPERLINPELLAQPQLRARHLRGAG
ncbi:MAG: NAD(P)-dependent oxidoreductase [Thermomicrobiales bacterium]